MKTLQEYIKEVLGETIVVNRLPEHEVAKLPMYVNQLYRIYTTRLLGVELVLAQLIDDENISVAQTEKQIRNLRNLFNKTVVLLLDHVVSYNRIRLIRKKVNFIVPGKQVFLPEMLVDLKDGDTTKSSFKENQKLIPSAQVIVLYQILGLSELWDIEQKPFKEIAFKLNYSPMAISKAVENLQVLDLVTVAGEKEKFVQFNYDKVKLWEKIDENDFWNYPVFKRVYIDSLPPGIKTWDCNTSALPEYSDMNPSRQNYVAIGRTEYNRLNKQNLLLNANPTEGNYCVEVWKYNPGALVDAAIFTEQTVDPLSLYLTLKSTPDERIELALEQIKEKYIYG
ncbi:MarR family transcriptional regulator [Sunxiuqinia indica]|uniref:MarR family transcriptional regulator n=1 Tax=Sunxiuqinia indica TaxID=2692584 RepID=UPI00135B7783|nr:MarR family transcriptional regulator [Sunxiuqinia indica]